MTTSINLTTPYHQQDTGYYCGAASAQMVLDKLGVGLIDQTALYAISHGNPPVPNWYTHPNGLRDVLNAKKPNTLSSTFIVDAQGTVAEAMSRVLAALSEGNSPVGSLVQDGNHWVVTHGIQTDPPAQPSDSPTIIGVWISDPWPPVTTPGPVPPHLDPDACASHGEPNQYVSWAAWNSSDYFDATDIGNNTAQFVSVLVPPTSGGEKALSLAGLPEFVMDLGPESEELISSDDAIGAVKRGVVRHGLASEMKPLMSNVLSSSDHETASTFLVQRLDASASRYFLVLLQSLHGAVLSMVEEKGGTFDGARFLSSEEASHILTAESLQKMLRSAASVELPGVGHVDTAEAAVAPTLVWKLCVESRSPYFPFYRVVAENITFFAGLTGRLYSNLNSKELRG